MSRFTCPCCGHLVFREAPGSYAICPICFWEDDAIQLAQPSLSGGANAVSLIEAQRTYLRFGVSETRFSKHVRRPRPTDHRDPDWRPIEADRDIDPRLAEPTEYFHQVVHETGDVSVLYYWRRPPAP